MARDPHPTLARSERLALCDLLLEVGPDAPTLCKGWTALDLAAHLVVRERRPDAGLGIVLPPARAWTERVQEQARRRGLDRLVDQIRNGPPALSPFRLLDGTVNTAEYLVHHEDVRRARPGWEPRQLPTATQDEVWARLRAAGRLLFRKVPVGLVLSRPDGETHLAKAGAPAVVLTGEPVELVLYAFGRRDHARVEVTGEPEVVAALAGAPLGV